MAADAALLERMAVVRSGLAVHFVGICAEADAVLKAVARWR